MAVFAAAAGVTWIAGIWLSRTTDVLDRRFGLGEALGGMVLPAAGRRRDGGSTWAQTSWLAILVFGLGIAGLVTLPR